MNWKLVRGGANGDSASDFARSAACFRKAPPVSSPWSAGPANWAAAPGRFSPRVSSTIGATYPHTPLLETLLEPVVRWPEARSAEYP